ncbi:flagellar motor protein MotB [Lederbergia lenta]|uniref:Chemotaxis protein MotB n=1 Tax=Lederbergia lenta TaxID=1467 RepID=A0A2X4W5J0_LEDLE|nr:flagellar motor protein MotB [Lederbergia lenta]MCM3111024.1 flagellar motor protein MotB [Lederbergia lenta]MEC2325588.1 flagellar motor protein MotB [Lederbergia lenta]SQI54202.1 chemotaxis protein MotB [Lederbergia lenta]
MAKRRKKKADEGHVDESWLLPYADLLTLLLALFIVLFASSAVDAQKFQQMSQVFNGIFMGGTGPIEYQSPVEDEDHSKDHPEKSQTGSSGTDEVVEPEENVTEIIDESHEIFELQDQQELEAVQAKVNAYIQKNDMNNKFDTALTSEGLLLTIRDNVLFQSGRAEVRKEDEKTARELAVLLEMEPPRNIIISGHTDNIPIRNAAFNSNWELSVMRAVNFMKILLEDEKLDPRLFSAKGFGEFVPIGDNNTDEGRALNRRVEVLILPRTPADAE